MTIKTADLPANIGHVARFFSPSINENRVVTRLSKGGDSTAQLFHIAGGPIEITKDINQTLTILNVWGFEGAQVAA